MGWSALSSGHQFDRMLPMVQMSRSYPLGGCSKRAFDLVVAGGTWVLLGPLVIMIAALVRLVIGGPVLRRKACIGFGGRSFSSLSFNTDADARGRQWASSLASALRRSGLAAHAAAAQRPTRRDELRRAAAAQPRGMAKGTSNESARLYERPGMTSAWLISDGARPQRERVGQDWLIGCDVSVLLKLLLAARRPNS